MIELNKLADEQYLATYKRAKNTPTIKADPISCLKHAAGEVVEATEAFKELTHEDSEVKKQNFAFELADIICCVMSCAAQYNIDLEQTIKNRVENNTKRAIGIGDKL